MSKVHYWLTNRGFMALSIRSFKDGHSQISRQRRVDVVIFWRQLRTIGPILYLGMRRSMMRHWLTFLRELGLG